MLTQVFLPKLTFYKIEGLLYRRPPPSPAGCLRRSREWRIWATNGPEKERRKSGEVPLFINLTHSHHPPPLLLSVEVSEREEEGEDEDEDEEEDEEEELA